LLEIVDIFDDLVSKDKESREGGHTVEEALNIMMNDYINKNLRLDPVLFYVFIEFLKEYVGKEQVLNADYF
ncbi:MAG: phosphohydrolase, partial [Spirochaetes bacterium]|nr:phosphohydrolase [Spirochaetota bacterium]